MPYIAKHLTKNSYDEKKALLMVSDIHPIKPGAPKWEWFDKLRFI